MTPKDFCYWLQGFMELSDLSKGINVHQATMIGEHLQLVFQKETRSMNEVITDNVWGLNEEAYDLTKGYSVPTATFATLVEPLMAGYVGEYDKLDQLVNYDPELKGKFVAVGTIPAHTFNCRGHKIRKEDLVLIDKVDNDPDYKIIRRLTAFSNDEEKIKIVLVGKDNSVDLSEKLQFIFHLKGPQVDELIASTVVGAVVC